MSLNAKYISFRVIIDRIFENPLMQDINEDSIIRYIADCIKLIGAPAAYEDKLALIEIKNYRAELPCDLVYIQQTRRVSGTTLYPMRYSSDTFHSAYHEVGSPDFNHNFEHTYSINNGAIYTDFKEGTVEQSYKGLMVDPEGYPMITDNIKFIESIQNYIKVKHYTIQWELGKIPDKVLEAAKQEYAWYVGAAQTMGHLQSIDQAESFKNAFTRLIINPTAARTQFQDFGRQEFRKNI